jgi:ornithine carbamoyltransferase
VNGGDLLSVADLGPAEVGDLLRAAALVKERRFDPRSPRPLAGRTVALLFQKPSLRTRVSFEIAVRELGGEPIYLGQQEVGLGTRESPEDVARTLDRWVAAIVARTFEHASVAALGAASSVPVINALSDLEHPCQALADLLTLRERFGRLRRISVAFVGEGNNVFHSFALAAAGQGMEVRLAHPDRFGPDPAVMAKAGSLAAAAGGRLSIGNDPAAAVRGADAVYTDTWISMGDEAESDRRRAAFAGYQVDRGLLALAAPHAVILHCLPAHRGEEIEAEVIDGPRSVVFDQSENRLHVQKALLQTLVAPVQEAVPVPRLRPAAAVAAR